MIFEGTGLSFSIIKDSNIQESILKDNPVPSNIIKPKKLHTASREILEEQHKKTALSNEEMLLNIQNKVFSVLGPLTKLWATMEGEKTDILQTSQEQIMPEVEENLNTVSTGFEQVITLLGQVINPIVYQRQLGVLTAVFNEKKKAKDLMKDMKGLMNEDNEELFGPKFEESVVKNQKTKTKTKEIIGTSSNRSKSNTNQRMPFRGGPPFRGSRGGGRGSAFFTRGFNYSRGTYQNRRGKTNISGNSAFRKILQSPSNSKENISKCITSSSPSRETKFPRELEDSNKRLSNIRLSSALQNSICGQGITLPTESSESIKNELCGTTNNRPGNFQHARKRGHIKSDSLQKSIPKYAIYSEEKRRGQSPCNKSETSELLHSLSTLQDGRT